MYGISIGLFLVAFQAACYGAPGHAFPRPRLPVVFLKEYRAEKRTARCTPAQYDKHKSCAYFEAQNYCSERSKYYNWMQENCYATCGNCAMPPTPPPKVEINTCLQAHNAKRSLHGAAPLVWDATLARHAKEWAEVLVRWGEMEHARDTGEGENLYWYKGSKVATCVEAVKSWYGEEPDYPYNNPPKTYQEFYAGKKIGHFTQIVWKGTRKVGVALATKKAGGWTETYIVARYSPQGNILGHFAANVARPRRY